MINTTELIKAFINSHHGWAVAGQFEDTFDGGEEFEHQNTNALNYIQDTIVDLIDSGLLSSDAESELEEYKDRLVKYLSEMTYVKDEEDGE